MHVLEIIHVPMHDNNKLDVRRRRIIITRLEWPHAGFHALGICTMLPEARQIFTGFF